MNLNTIRYIDNNLTFTRMGFGLEKFGFGKKNAEEQPAVIENPAETEPSATTTETEPDYSRRNFVIGGIAAVAGSTLLGEDAEAARYRVPNYTTDRRDTIIERNIQSEARRKKDTSLIMPATVLEPHAASSLADLRRIFFRCLPAGARTKSASPHVRRYGRVTLSRINR